MLLVHEAILHVGKNPNRINGTQRGLDPFQQLSMRLQIINHLEIPIFNCMGEASVTFRNKAVEKHETSNEISIKIPGLTYHSLFIAH